jgi:hypothetical protein
MRPDLDKTLFFENSAILLANFKMTRVGPFWGIRFDRSTGEAVDKKGKLQVAWNRVGEDLVSLKKHLSTAVLKPRSRTLLLLDPATRGDLIEELWIIFKKLLPVTMSSNSYGLVGASKILFSVLPEIALPIDNAMWLKVFKTVDYGEVIRLMSEEILKWEAMSGRELQECEKSDIKTLPAVYNVMAMKARNGALPNDLVAKKQE